MEVNVTDIGMPSSSVHQVLTPNMGTPVHPAASSQKVHVNLSPKDKDSNPNISLSSDKPYKTWPNLDTGTPEHPAASSQNEHVNLSPKVKDSNPKDSNLNISSNTDKPDKAQPNIVFPSPGSEDRSIGAELVCAIIEKHGPELPPKDGNIIMNKDQDCRPGTTTKDEIRPIMNHQPLITLRCLTSAEIESATKPSKKKVIKIRKAEGVYPSARTASKYMFGLSKYGIK